ncbi:MAG: hypothetical protein J0L81_09375 [Caulobacterales bacterium]|jgi:hypothetical protein|nr:hypothetical protein [Caulobacterales bacterium]
MRFIASLTALAFLAACATAPASAPAQPGAPSVAPSSSAHARLTQMLSAAGRQDAPTQAEITRAFGAPDIARQDGAGAALTYRFENCALLLLFAADARNAMRLTESHASARRNGAAAPSPDQCAAEAAARRS